MGECEVNTVIHVHTREVQGYWFCLPICCHQLHRTNHRLYCHQLLATWTWFFFRVNRKKNGGVLNLLTRVGFYCKRFQIFCPCSLEKQRMRTEQNRTEQKCKESSVTSDVNNVPVFVFDFCFCFCFFTFSSWSKK